MMAALEFASMYIEQNDEIESPRGKRQSGTVWAKKMIPSQISRPHPNFGELGRLNVGGWYASKDRTLQIPCGCASMSSKLQ